VEKFQNAVAICSGASSMGGRTELIRLGGQRCVGRVHSVVYNSVREYVFYVFFQISKKHDFLRFFEMTYQKVVKSL